MAEHWIASRTLTDADGKPVLEVRIGLPRPADPLIGSVPLCSRLPVSPAKYASRRSTCRARTRSAARGHRCGAPRPALAESWRQLVTFIRDLEQGYEAEQSEDVGLQRRPLDTGADNSWASLKWRLDPLVQISEDLYPEETCCGKELARRMFLTGLGFTQLEQGAQWVEASWRMNPIAKENPEPDLRRLCGDWFIDELFYWRKECGKMIGAVVTRSRGVARRCRPGRASSSRRCAGRQRRRWGTGRCISRGCTSGSSGGAGGAAADP